MGVRKLQEGEGLESFLNPLLRWTQGKLGLRVTSEFLSLEFVLNSQRILGALVEQQNWIGLKHKLIWLNPGLSRHHATKVLAHELGHYFLTPMNTPTPLAEAQAESTAFLVTQGLGVDIGDYSAIYLAHFGVTPEMVKKEEGRIIEAAGRILDGIR